MERQLKTTALHEIVLGLRQTLNSLQESVPVGLLEIDLTIPFAGKLAHKTVSPSVDDFCDATLLTEDINLVDISDIWMIRIADGKEQARKIEIWKL